MDQAVVDFCSVFFTLISWIVNIFQNGCSKLLVTFVMIAHLKSSRCIGYIFIMFICIGKTNFSTPIAISRRRFMTRMSLLDPLILVKLLLCGDKLLQMFRVVFNSNTHVGSFKIYIQNLIYNDLTI